MIELRMGATDENRRWLIEIANARRPVTIATRENMVLVRIVDEAGRLTATFEPLVFKIEAA